MCVISFATLEEFARDRVAELMANLTTGGVPFGALPMPLQIAATVNSGRAAMRHIKWAAKSDAAKISFMRQLAAEIGSTGTATYTISSFSFGREGSNLSESSFIEPLAAVGISKPWKTVNALVSRLGVSGIPAKNMFETVANRRHTAAHDGSAAIQTADLLQFMDFAVAVAAAMDWLLDESIQRIIANAQGQTPYVGSIGHQDIRLRFVEKRTKNQWAERVEGAAKARKLFRQRKQALVFAQKNALRHGERVCLMTPQGIISEWY